jgi:luciferase family oxidoreductase group 1
MNPRSTQPRLSVLDQSVACLGRGEDEALRDTLALAEATEVWGYERFWVSEHHGMPTIVGSAPEVLLAAIAARTRRIRLGSAGVMLPHYSAYKVAETFRVLDALAPGRLDLGVGRAPGSDRATARALNPHVSGMAEDFPEQIQDLAAWVSGRMHQGLVAHPCPPMDGEAPASEGSEGSDASLASAAAPASGAVPAPDRVPQLWILGSSDYGARLAAHLGLPYAFAYFFMDGQGVEQALSLYRSLYRPSARFPKPQATICVWALTAPTEAEARFHALSRERWRLDRERGLLRPLLPPADIEAQGFSEMELARLTPMRQRAFVGTPEQVSERLHGLASELQLDELVINTWAYDRHARRESYRLLMQAIRG